MTQTVYRSFQLIFFFFFFFFYVCMYVCMYVCIKLERFMISLNIYDEDFLEIAELRTLIQELINREGVYMRPEMKSTRFTI